VETIHSISPFCILLCYSWSSHMPKVLAPCNLPLEYPWVPIDIVTVFSSPLPRTCWRRRWRQCSQLRTQQNPREWHQDQLAPSSGVQAKSVTLRWGVVAYTCNPSSLGDRNRRSEVPGQPRQKLVSLYLKNKVLGPGSISRASIRPWVQTLVLPKKRKETECDPQSLGGRSNEKPFWGSSQVLGKEERGIS
jgi:hypothetical protein